MLGISILQLIDFFFWRALFCREHPWDDCCEFAVGPKIIWLWDLNTFELAQCAITGWAFRSVSIHLPSSGKFSSFSFGESLRFLSLLKAKLLDLNNQISRQKIQQHQWILCTLSKVHQQYQPQNSRQKSLTYWNQQYRAPVINCIDEFPGTIATRFLISGRRNQMQTTMSGCRIQ